MEVLNRATALLYVLDCICVELSDVVLHESKVIKDKNSGKFQHRAEKLKSAHKNMFGVMEHNIETGSLDEIKKRVELVMNDLWEL